MVGLLSEPECRAAAILATLAIDIPAVMLRWPGLVEIESRSRGGAKIKPFSNDVQTALELARQRLAVFTPPLEMATEHILLGLVAADHEVSVWLRQRGLDPDVLEVEIRNLYGYPLEVKKGEQGEEKAESSLGARVPRLACPTVFSALLDKPAVAPNPSNDD